MVGSGCGRRTGKLRPQLEDLAGSKAVLRVWWVTDRARLMTGVGSVQFMTGMYVTELAPSRIRGFLLIFYSFW